VLSGDEHVAEYQPPANVQPMPAGADLAELVASGELAAGIGIDADRPELAPLVEDATDAGFAALRATGHYPINHLIVVRDDVLAAHPGLAEEIFAAFTAAKNEYVEALRSDAIEAPTKVDRMYREVMDITGADPLPYGIEPNRAVLEELIGHAVRQQILRTAPDIDGLFAADARHLVG
jgi:4,5-dihydroxyphthalate decarboxylase